MSGMGNVALFGLLAFLACGVALAFVLPPLLRRSPNSGDVDRMAVNIAIYRDQLQDLENDLKNSELNQEQYQGAKLEIEKNFSEDVPVAESQSQAVLGGKWVGLLVALAFPAAAGGFYLALGNPAALNPSSVASEATQAEHDATAMLATLEAKLKSKPDDATGWTMLGRSYGALGRWRESSQAYAKAATLLPGDARILADYAEVLALAQGRAFEGKPWELIEAALKINPKDEKALELAGIAAFQKEDYAKAAEYWKSLLKLIPADSDYARDIKAALLDVEKAALGKAPSADKGKQPAAGGGSAAISGTVTVGKKLAGQFQPNDVVFIFAQKPGSKMPLAIDKTEAAKLPYHYTLDDTSAMSSGDKLSTQSEVVVTARISKSGQATAQSGDLQGKSAAVKVGQQGANVVIDSVLP
ncbi:MAG: c-type cytochrome biogenesis protein CcmI [Sulfuricella sp.]|nr:c-type cytochrome biogenesis protein CcmI [Sulfuricella sp.]